VRVRGGELVVLVALALAGCSVARDQGAKQDLVEPATAPGLAADVDSSFRAHGQAGLERLQQSPMQRICSQPQPDPSQAGARQQVQRQALESVRYPDDARWLGDWHRGEQIAQSRLGRQYSDPPDAPGGGNCYACHELSGAEIAFGTIGPSLNHYLQHNGSSDDALRRTWARIWNPHAFNVCSVMPRFGDADILTAEQIRDVMALLLDPDSPVNR
jgi:L-cysteine S-thiosulfotransferase